MSKRASARQEPPVTPLRIPQGIDTVVVYGGVFDPPHTFHVEEVPHLIRRSFGETAWLLYVPAARSPLKPDGPVASNAQRVAMLRLALGKNRVWSDECDRAKWLRARGRERPSYTVDTLRRLKAMLPQGLTVRLLIGADQAKHFHLWRSARTVIRLAEPAVMMRPPISTRAALVRAMDAAFWSPAERAAWGRRLLTNKVQPTSSTSVRERIAAGGSPGVWRDVPPRVALFIAQRGLYGARRQRSAMMRGAEASRARARASR